MLHYDLGASTYALFASIALLLPLYAQQGGPSSETFLKHIFPSRDYITAGNPGVAGGSSAAGTAGNGIFYHGGPLMTGTPNVYYIWYGNWAADPTGVTILQHFAQFDGGSPYYGINTTYYDGSATPISNAINFGPSYTDNYSRGKVLFDSDILAIVSAAITGGHLPSDPNGIYFVLTWQDVQEWEDVQKTSGFITKYCGWHTRGTIGGVDIKYAFVGDANTQGLQHCAAQTSSSPNGDPAIDAMASVVAHELEESVSDPDLNAWYDNSGNENADKCAWMFGTTYYASNGSLANMNLGGLDYLIQLNWVNAWGGYCARRLGFTLDVDGDGKATPLTDGIIIIRYLFGLSGPALTANALGSGATRTDPNAIKAYLDAMKAQGLLDVDGNGQATALTDGIIIDRYLFGLSGPALTANALGPGATRTDPAAIAAFLKNLMP